MTVQPEQSQFGGMRSTMAQIAPHVALELGPFAEAAVRYARVGLAVVPCGGSDGKVPRIRTRTMKRGLSLAAIERRMPSWGSSNVGILTGTRSGVTIIDIDDSQLKRIPLILKHIRHERSSWRIRLRRGEARRGQFGGEGCAASARQLCADTP